MRENLHELLVGLGGVPGWKEGLILVDWNLVPPPLIVVAQVFGILKKRTMSVPPKWLRRFPLEKDEFLNFAIG